MLSPQLSVALKEWSVTIDALLSGLQVILLRKGGIYESAGEFELEHRQFLFFPTFLHQSRGMVKEQWREQIQGVAAEPGLVTLSAAGIVTDIIQVRDRARMDRLEDQHIWTVPLIDMRFNYRPENPLYVLIVRAIRLRQPITVENTPAYAGCKSWVPLETPIAAAGDAVLADRIFNERQTTIRERLETQ